MPLSTIRFPAEGVGPYGLTWDRGGTTGEISGVFQPGSRQGQMFAATSGIITATATASLRIWRLTNPNASGKTVYVQYIKVTHWAVAAAATVVSFELAKTTDAPGAGTAISAQDILEHNVAAVATLASLPTSGTQATAKVAAFGSEVAAAAPREYFLWDALGIPFDAHLEIPANTGLTLATNGTPDIDHRFVIQCIWEEV